MANSLLFYKTYNIKFFLTSKKTLEHVIHIYAVLSHNISCRYIFFYYQMSKTCYHQKSFNQFFKLLYYHIFKKTEKEYCLISDYTSYLFFLQKLPGFDLLYKIESILLWNNCKAI